MKKWILSVIFALCMVVAMAPVMSTTAAAAEEECTCLIQCTEGHMNADCPVCSQAEVTVGNCKGRFPWSGEFLGDLQLQAIMNLNPTIQTTYYFSLSRGQIVTFLYRGRENTLG